MKKLLIIAISLLMVFTLGACSSKEETPATEPVVENNSPIKSVEIFGKEYSLPLTLGTLAKDGVEFVPVFMENVGSGNNENVFLCKDNEYIRVGVHNSSNELKSVTDESLIIKSIIFRNADSYTNAKEIPSVKIAGVGVGDETGNIEAVYGEPTNVNQLDSNVLEKVWVFESETENVRIQFMEIDGMMYGCELWLPTE